MLLHFPALFRPIAKVLMGIAFLSLVACGGGDGGNGERRSSVLTEQSDRDYTERVLYAGGFFAEAGTDLLGDLLDTMENAGELALDADNSVSYACTDGGNATLTVQDNDGVIESGDYIEITAQDCSEDGGSTYVTGTVRLTLTSVDGFDYGAQTGSASMTVKFTDFSIRSTEDGVPVTHRLDGSWQSSVRFTAGLARVAGDTVVEMEFVVPASESFQLSRAKGGETMALTLQGLNERVQVDESNNSYLIDFDVDTLTVVSGGQEASFQVQTDPPIQGLVDPADGMGDPTQGVVVIRDKATGARLRVEAMTGGMVQLSVDADGDGTYETTETVSWDSLG